MILERDGGEVGRRIGVLALDLARAREEVVTPAEVFDGAGGGVGSVLVSVDPGMTLAVVEGEGI